MSSVGSIGIASAPSIARPLAVARARWAGSRPAPRPSPARRRRAARARTASSRSSVRLDPARAVTPTGGGERDRPGDQHDVGAPLPRRLGEPVAHLAAGAIGDHPHRIDATRGSGPAVTTTRRPASRPSAAQQARGVRAGSSPARSSGPAAPTAPPPGRRSRDRRSRRPARRSALEVRLGLRVGEHLVVHGGREEHRARSRPAAAW